ncbi:MAG TPA: hypothetical protein VF207_07300 [Chthoniobacterales bacterium]|jgi:hypothetical protein
MSELQKRWFFSFAIGLALCFVCLAYIPQWQNYAPRVGDSIPKSPYLTPWTVIFVALLSLSLATIAFPVRSGYSIRTIVSKTLGVAVLCLATVFLLEYISGIRSPDLDLFFLPDAVGHRARLYSVRPTPHSAATSLLFSLALLFYDYRVRWRMRTFHIGSLAALILPSLAAIGYILQFFLAAETTTWLRSGLSIPAVILYFTLGSGFLGLSYRSDESHLPVARPGKDFWRWV